MARKRPLTRSAKTSAISAKTIKITPKSKPNENGFNSQSKSLMVLSKTCVNTSKSNSDLTNNAEMEQNRNTSLSLPHNGSSLTLKASYCDFSDDPLDYEDENVQTGQNINYPRTNNNSIVNEICSRRYVNMASTLSTVEDEENFSNVSHQRHIFSYCPDVVDESPLNLPIHLPTAQSKVLLDSPRSSFSECSNSSNNYLYDEGNSLDDYSITAEEEERLLQSDNESSSIIEVPSDNLEKANNCENYSDVSCQASIFRNSKVTMKGNQIIIKAVNANKPDFTPANKPDFTPAGKSKCWDIRYHPYNNYVFEEYNPSFNRTLHLKDIGYEPLSDEEEKTVTPTQSSSFTTVKVTLGANQERQFSKTDFKIPNLPPIKRPPTRPKKSTCASMELNSSKSRVTSDYSCISSVSNHIDHKDDDVISIAASSLCFDQMELDKQLSELKNSSEDLFNATQLQSDPFYVQNWLLTQVNNTQSTCSTPPLVVKIEGDTESARSQPAYVNFKEIPLFFKGLCYYFYINDKCCKVSCKLPHSVQPAVFISRCQSMNHTQLEECYNFASRFALLFRDMHPVFIKGFAIHKMQSKLIAIIDDIFAMNNTVLINKAIELIVEALCQIGLTLLEAVEKISFNIGFMRYPSLADILTDILSKEPNLSENWQEIKRICKAKNFIAPHTLETILRQIIHDPNESNRNLCKDIYNTIIKTELTDLSKIKNDYIRSLKTLVEFGNKPADCLSRSIDANLLNERRIFENATEQSQSDASSSDIDERIPLYSQTTTVGPGPSQWSPSSSSSSSGSCSSSSFSRSSGSSKGQFIASTNESTSLGRHSPYVPKKLNSSKKKNCSSTPDSINSPEKTITSSASKQVTCHRTVTLPSVCFPPLTQTAAATNLIQTTLFPERPIFGKFNYKPDFVFEKSLHNLLPAPKEQVVLNDPDIIKLNEVIKSANGNEFLQLLDQYKGPNTLQQFITMSIAHLKNNRQRPSNSLVDLVENLEVVKPGFRHDPFLKGVLEVIVFNLLIFVERKCLWTDGRKLIEMFCDWDSLISSKQFTTNQLTPIGRFIFLAKLLAEAKAFYKVYDILRSPDLRLLECPSNWPLFHCGNADLESRNLLLTDFFTNAYRHNVEVVCDMYKNIFQFNDIWQFDSFCFFNPMLEDMIDKEKISSLKHFFTDIELFYKKINRNILRAFLILMNKFITNTNILNIYIMAVQKGLFTFYTGQEPSIIVRTNMPDEELKFILLFYLHKYSCLPKNVCHDLKIEIKLPIEFMKTPRILRECTRSIIEVKESLKKLFFSITGIHLDDSDLNTVVYIPKDKLVNANVLKY